MGYGSYELPDGRWAGYNIEAECDKPGCEAVIDRGLSYLCGQEPDGHRDPSAPGCGKYHCADHEIDHDCPNPEGLPGDDEDMYDDG